METSQPPAIESFSYRWLINRKTSFDGVDKLLRTSANCYTEATSEEAKFKMTTSNTYIEEDQNFYFDIPICEPPAALVHADEIFSNGHIMPSNIKSFSPSNSVPTTPLSSLPSKPVTQSNMIIRYHSLKKWRKSSTLILQKYFGFLKPLWRKLGSRKCIRVDDIDRKEWEVKSWSSTPQPSPRRLSTSYSASDLCNMESKKCGISNTARVLMEVQSWSNSPQASPQQGPSCSTGDWCDIESSIYEAILHCKRSIEKREDASEEIKMM
ncbi:probable membrane-associated kinase regulator 6 [Cornus florida]|uniref:probable membrane-associated kinase regulator 6 n=1 Tax=Cornus florida TaxID=4283 RepID=UPI0028999D9D|nr:probable membrane-associated kinase regulator 6 [Cornus florida]